MDFIYGNVMEKIDDKVNLKGGCKYIFDKVDSELLVFGSSRAYRHYDTRVLSDSLQLSAYNCGQSAQSFIHNYVLLEELLKRYQPKMIIYDLNPKVDFMGANHSVYISSLRPYINRESVKEVVFSVDPLEKYKNTFSLYRYNSICNSLILEYLGVIEHKSINGFVPTYREMKKQIKEDDVTMQVDSLSLYYANKFIKRVKQDPNVKLIFVISPRWYGMDTSHVELAKELANNHHICLYDFSNNSSYVHNDSYFYDGTHMNAKGAELFTKELVTLFKRDSVISY